jgi:hypothetical protein
MKRLGRMAAALTIATAATTGTLLTGTAHASPAADTAWGTPITTTEPAVPTPALVVDVTVVTPLDTAWG